MALIAGGARGIGRAAVIVFARASASVAIGAPPGEAVVEADALAQALRASGTHAVGFEADTSTPDAMERMVPMALVEGKAIPYGIYDLGRNEGYVVVGTPHETPSFAAAAIRLWGLEVGR